jgi:hypothetical protein
MAAQDVTPAGARPRPAATGAVLPMLGIGKGITALDLVLIALYGIVVARWLAKHGAHALA